MLFGALLVLELNGLAFLFICRPWIVFISDQKNIFRDSGPSQTKTIRNH